MRWRKLGLIYRPEAGPEWRRSHAAVPVCEPLDDRHLAIVFSARDSEQRSLPGRVVVDLGNAGAAAQVRGPLLGLGARGTFDDSGVMPCWMLADGGERQIYYVGWNRAVTVPFQNALGVARASADLSGMSRVFDGPIVARSRRDPYFVAACAVVKTATGYRMWYLSCVGWFMQGDKPMHRYHLRQMDSEDGLAWGRDATVAIDFKDDREYAISRPTVLVENGVHHMWYSTRGDRYRIGYARSLDGTTWERRDDLVGIAPSENGWDSEMICYPHVFRMNNHLYMAYNGNNYGETGIGLAVLETPLA
jgi:hypothetical protein